MRTARARRDGFALAAAILALVVIGALVACATFVVTQEYRMSSNALVEQRAFAAAEGGLNGVLVRWGEGGTSLPLPPAAVGDVMTYAVVTATGDGAVVRVTRVTDSTFWAVSDGAVASGGAGPWGPRAARRTNLVLRLQADGTLRPAALRSWAQLF